MILTRDQIRSGLARTRTVEVPELGGQLLIGPLSVADLEGLMKARDEQSTFRFFALLLALSARDESGRLLFDGDGADGAEGVGFDVLKRVGLEILAFNGLAEPAAGEASDAAAPKGPASSTAPSGSGSLSLLSGSA